MKAEESCYVPIPVLTDFKDDTPEKTVMKEVIQRNYDMVKKDVREIVARELERISKDPVLSKLLPKQF